MTAFLPYQASASRSPPANSDLGLTAAVVAGVTAHGLIKMIKPRAEPPRSAADETRRESVRWRAW